MQTNRMIQITYDVIVPQQVIDFVTTAQAGAVVLFLGTVRELTHGRKTVSLTYEAYADMAIAIMHDIAEEAQTRWPIAKVAAVHRLGHLNLCETSIALAVSSPHRHDALQASQFLIDEIKTRVPVWKKEHWDDGTTEWIHPGLPGE